MSEKPLRIVLELALPPQIRFADAAAGASQIVREVEKIETAVAEGVAVHHRVDRVVIEMGYDTEEVEE